VLGAPFDLNVPSAAALRADVIDANPGDAISDQLRVSSLTPGLGAPGTFFNSIDARLRLDFGQDTFNSAALPTTLDFADLSSGEFQINSVRNFTNDGVTLTQGSALNAEFVLTSLTRVAPVPLPAGALLLLSAVALLGAARARRRCA
jgi:hypothetical protein